MKRKILVGMMMAMTLLAGCQNKNIGNNDQGIVTVSEIKGKYGAVSKSNAIAPLYNMAPDEEFDFKFKCNVNEEYCTDELVTVHTYKECNPESMIYTYSNYEETDDGGCILTISPISAVLETEGDENKRVWGNAPMYYIAIWYDMESEKLLKLDEPMIIPFTVKQEVQAPNVKGVVDKNGCFSLSWDEVPGATEYRVYTLTNSDNWTGHSNKPVDGAENGYQNCSLLFMEAVTDTTFTNFSGSGENVTRYERSLGSREYIISQNVCVNGEFYVSAVVDGVESGFDRGVVTADLKLPYKLTDESDIMFNRYDDVALLPRTLDVINIDGTVTERKVLYTFQLQDTYIQGVQSPEYAYRIEGTALTGCVSMEVDDPDFEYPRVIGKESLTGFVEPQSDISALPDNGDFEKEQEKDLDAGEMISKHIEESLKKSEERQPEGVAKPDDDIMIFADSPEEEWIAINMANGETEISVEAFPSLQVYDELEDVLNKVYYQNPYVLGLYRYKYNHGTATLTVDYVYDKEEIKSRQQEIHQAADDILKKIIDDGMDDSEKQMAIYTYLEENCEYDNEALDTAMESDFRKTGDSTHEDAFNAYGILVKKKGVCQSYACAYKLLCQMSGVECNVVTGYLDGNLPHAWNGVNIDGQWYQTDATNNGRTTGIPYYLYNSDTEIAGDTGYSEDKFYDLDYKLSEYITNNPDYEYYHVNNLCAASLEEYKRVLSDVLKSGAADVICVRYTEDFPSQKEVAKAIAESYNMAGREDELNELSLFMANGYIAVSKVN